MPRTSDLVKKDTRASKAHPDFFAHFPTNNTFSAWGYDAISLILNATASISPKEYLQTTTGYIGAYNSYTFDPFGELHLEYELRIIKDGAYQSFPDQLGQ